jgi:hypothetical protein
MAAAPGNPRDPPFRVPVFVLELECTMVLESPAATHLRSRDEPSQTANSLQLSLQMCK